MSNVRTGRRSLTASKLFRAAVGAVILISQGGKLLAEHRSVSPSEADTLVKCVLMSVYQAGCAENYSVLRDLGSPEFRQRNTLLGLGVRFNRLKEEPDFIAEFILSAPIVNEATLSAGGQWLRLKGFYQENQVQLGFDLVFQKAARRAWVIDSIVIETSTEIYRTSDVECEAGRPEFMEELDSGIQIVPAGGREQLRLVNPVNDQASNVDKRKIRLREKPSSRNAIPRQH